MINISIANIKTFLFIRFIIRRKNEMRFPIYSMKGVAIELRDKDANILANMYATNKT